MTPQMPHPLRLVAAAIVLLLDASTADAVDIFYESFTPANVSCTGTGPNPFPANWSLFNVDNRAPDAQVAYVTNAWIVREDFKFDTAQCAAFSTSFYNPAGQADDWMWTPAITVPVGGSTLSWRAVAYDPNYADGYEVRIMTGAAPTQANQLTSTVVYSTAAEQAAWTQRGFDLAAYAGQTIYVGFRNHSTDKFVLLVDDVRIVDTSPDLVARAPVPAYTTEYARAPLGMDIVPALAVTAYNGGGSILTNVTGTAQARVDGAAFGPALPATNSIATLAINASGPLTFGAPAAYAGEGTWTTQYALTSSQNASDSNPANNTIEIPGVTIGGNEFARWEGAATGMIGIGAGTGGELGVMLTIPADGWYAGAHFAMNAIPPDDGQTPPNANICPGFDYVLNLRAFDEANAVPDATIIDTTEPVACEYDTAYSVDTPFVNGPHFLTAGTYVLTAVEPVNGPTLPLLLHDNRFVAGTTWVNWPSNPLNRWAHFEEFGSSFARTPELSLLAGAPEPPIFADGFDGIAARVAGFHRINRAPSPMVRRTLREQPPTRLVEAANR